jgi:sRNA-binding protein
MSNPRPPASDLLPLLAEAFPQTFFADPKPVRPLKINIHHDLKALRQAHVLPAELDPGQIKRLLRWYTRQTCYLQALARGEGRIDLTGAVVDRDIPEPIREQARQEIVRRQHQRARTEGTGKAATANQPSAAPLSRLVAAFPQTFFLDPKPVRPLKVFLYRDLLRLAKAGALPEGVDPTQLKPFLRWYGGRTSYLNTLARGLGRVDLTGAVVTATIPEAIRQRARAEVQRRREHQVARAAMTAAAAPPPPAPKPGPIPYSLEDLYAMAVDAKLEITLKFSTLPNAQPAGQGKMAFALKTQDGQFITTEVNQKTWNKLAKAAADWPPWVAALTGTIGERTDKGFRLENPGLQVFERQPKAPADTAPSRAETTPAPVSPSAEPAPVPPATAANPDLIHPKPVLSLKNRKITP